jgi:hypothetical protein
MSKSTQIQAETDKYTLLGALDPDTGNIYPVQMGDTTVLGLASQLYVWNTDTLVWDKMTQPSIAADTINVNSTPDTTDLSTDNSTTAQLGIDAVYTGTGEDVLGYAQVTISIYSDVDSAASGMQFQWSQDNSNWDDSYDFTLDFSSSPARRFQFPVCARYFRVKYTNGGTGTAQFRVQTILHRGNVLTSIHRIGGTLTGDRSCQVVKASIVGETTGGGGGYVNVKVEPSGALAIEDANSADALTALQAIQAETEDNLQDYFMGGFETIGTADYVAYEDKAGNYYVMKVENSTGVVTYAVGTGGEPGPGGYAALSYGAFNTKF